MINNGSTGELKTKTPISHETIYKIMLGVTLGVSAIFFLKNIIGGELIASLAIGACLAVFTTVVLMLKKRNTKADVREMVVSVAILFLIFIISQFSGASYSDDFSLYLAAIGMAALYFKPNISKIQMILTAILLVAMYITHPEKSGGLSQYILCYAVTMVAASVFYIAVKRGRAFIGISDEKAVEALKLVDSIRQMGVDLQKDFESSLVRIDDSTTNLLNGSKSITQGANDVSNSSIDVHNKIEETALQIDELNNEVRKFEEALNVNQENVHTMNSQLNVVTDIVKEANQVFGQMEERMKEIGKIAEKLSTISFNITLLSLNASIEASRADRKGAGFAVVATEMRKLAASSDEFSDQVADVVKQVLSQVEKTSERFAESVVAIEGSQSVMNDLNAGFDRLKEQFVELYTNIEEQNNSVSQVDYIFGALDSKVSEMRNYSIANENAVNSIIEAMDVYKVNISNVIENTKNV